MTAEQLYIGAEFIMILILAYNVGKLKVRIKKLEKDIFAIFHYGGQ